MVSVCAERDDIVQTLGPDRSCRQFFRQNIEEFKERKMPVKSEQNIEMLGAWYLDFLGSAGS